MSINGLPGGEIIQVGGRSQTNSQRASTSRLAWVSNKAVYCGLMHDRDEWEIAKTFFNSITRRIFDAAGVNAEFETVHSDYESPPSDPKRTADQTRDIRESLAQGMGEVLAASFPRLDNAQVQRQSKLASSCAEQQWGGLGMQGTNDRVEFLYDASRLFSFARSYFHVGTDRPFDVVQFIKTIISQKPRSEIYISIGYKNHGKTDTRASWPRNHLSPSESITSSPENSATFWGFPRPCVASVWNIMRTYLPSNAGSKYNKSSPAANSCALHPTGMRDVYVKSSIAHRA